MKANKKRNKHKAEQKPEEGRKYIKETQLLVCLAGVLFFRYQIITA